MSKTKRKKPATPRGPGYGPVTNRRKQNEPLAPKGGKFHQRTRLTRVPVDDPGPEDLTHFDATPEEQAADFFDSRALLVRDDE